MAEPRLRLVPGTKYRAHDGRELAVRSSSGDQVFVIHVVGVGNHEPLGVMTVSEFEDLVLGPKKQAQEN